MSLGIGVMLNMLGGNKETVAAVAASTNRIAKKVWLEDDAILFDLDGVGILKIWDDGQSCCENRYMVTADDLTEYVGAKLISFELKDAVCNEVGEYGDEHEIQFLDITTDKGVIQCSMHNEHNGYYGGFGVQARIV